MLNKAKHLTLQRWTSTGTPFSDSTTTIVHTPFVPTYYEPDPTTIILSIPLGLRHDTTGHIIIMHLHGHVVMCCGYLEKKEWGCEISLYFLYLSAPDVSSDPSWNPAQLIHNG